MDETYASNVDNLNELARQYRQSEIDKAEVMKQSVLDKFNDKLTDYSEKWKAVEEGGKDELAGQFGLKGVYRGGKKIYDLYKKYKNSNSGETDEDKPSGLEDPEADGKIEAGDRPQAPEEPSPDFDPVAARASQAERFRSRLAELGEDEPEEDEEELTSARNVATLRGEGDTSPAEAPTDAPSGVQVSGAGQAPSQESGIESATGDAVQESEKIGGDAIKQTGKNLGKEVGEDLAETAGEGLGEAGGEALGATILSAIPVVGEVGLAVGGLVAIGEGIYHLFHHPHKPQVNAPIKASLVPQSVSQKYANALPSFDSSSDNMPSDAVF
jgi:hypothetical protein